MKTEEIKNQAPVLLTRRQAAALLGCDYGTLATWKYTKRYDLPCIKDGILAKLSYNYDIAVTCTPENNTKSCRV